MILLVRLVPGASTYISLTMIVSGNRTPVAAAYAFVFSALSDVEGLQIHTKDEECKEYKLMLAKGCVASEVPVILLIRHRHLSASLTGQAVQAETQEFD